MLFSVFPRYLILLGVFFLYVGVLFGVSNVFYYGFLFGFCAYFTYRLSGNSLASPGVWFSGIVALYGMSLPVLNYFGYYEALFPEDILRCVVLFVSGIFMVSAFMESDNLFSCDVIDIYPSVRYLYRFFFGVQIFYLVFYVAYFGGAKLDAAILGLNKFSIVQQWFVVFYAANIVCLYSLGLSKTKFIISAVFLALLSAVATGERDVVAGIILVTLVVSSVYERKPFYIYLFFVSCGLGVFTVLQWFRNVFSDSDVGYYSDLPFWVEVLKGEPLSASRNLDYLMMYVGPTGNGWGGFFTDLISAVVPKFVFYFENSENWFNKEFYSSVVDIGGGVGFGLVANFYLYGGVFSVFVFSILMPVFVYFARKHLFASFYGFVGFVSSIPLIVHAVRSDISVFFGSPLRGVLPACLLIYFFVKVNRSRVC